MTPSAAVLRDRGLRPADDRTVSVSGWRLPAVLAIVCALVLASTSGMPPAAGADTATAPEPAASEDGPDAIVVEDDATQPVFSYEDAIRDVVKVEGAVSSQDGDDELDRIHVDIIRPAASDDGLEVPTIILPSPYFAELGVGPTNETKADPNGPLDHFPAYYDNVFVPRGYAVALVDLAGTRGSSGCTDLGGPAEVANTTRVVEWLAGDAGAVAYDVDGDQVDADWSSGRSAIIGKSWNGTVANGVAATGVDGLETIVPIVAISSWHQYFWHNGARFSGFSPLGLANGVRDVPAEECSDVIDDLDEAATIDDPEDPFWEQRDYIRDADQVEASVFVVHGLNDYNVKPHDYGRWWDALAEHDVDRKIWLSQVAHEEPFDFRRDTWIETIHRWFDHWLYDVDNGIMDEPIADVEYAPDQWASYKDWPGGERTPLPLDEPHGDDPRSGVLSLERAGSDPDVQTFTEAHQHRDDAVEDPFDEREDRLVYLTRQLAEPIRVSGTSMDISLDVGIEGSDATLSAFLIDYGEAERTDWDSDGGIDRLESVTCFGEGTEQDDGCFPDVQRRTHTRAFEVVARGWANASYLTGLDDGFHPDDRHRLDWDIIADDYTFEAGHRIGIIVAGSSTRLQDPGTRSSIEVNLAESQVDLPIVGGADALEHALRAPEVDIDDDQGVINEGETLEVEASFTYPGTEEDGFTASVGCYDVEGDHLEVDGEVTIDDVDEDASLLEGTVAAECPYGDTSESEPGSGEPFSGTVSVADVEGGTGSTGFDVVVANVDPTVEIDTSDARDHDATPTFVTGVDEQLELAAQVTDPGSDDLLLTWDWGDGSDTEATYLNDPDVGDDPFPSPDVNPRDVTDEQVHAWGESCPHHVALTAVDDDRGQGTDEVVVIVVGDADQPRSAGYWQVTTAPGRGGPGDVDDATLACYLDSIDRLSRVFHDVRDASDPHEVLHHRHIDGAMADLLDRQLLAAWLNVTHGALGLDDEVDTTGDGQPDATVDAALTSAEDARLDPDATRSELEAHKDALETINTAG